MILPPAVLWADPGKMTGLAVIERGMFSCCELPFQAACGRVHELCRRWQGLLWAGYERYTVTARTHRLSPQADAIQVIGVIRYLAGAYGCRLLPPSGQHTPDRAEQDRLKALGWWRPGEDDAQSAACHLLRWLESTGSAPPAVRAVRGAEHGHGGQGHQ